MAQTTSFLFVSIVLIARACSRGASAAGSATAAAPPPMRFNDLYDALSMMGSGYDNITSDFLNLAATLRDPSNDMRPADALRIPNVSVTLLVPSNDALRAVLNVDRILGLDLVAVSQNKSKGGATTAHVDTMLAVLKSWIVPQPYPTLSDAMRLMTLQSAELVVRSSKSTGVTIESPGSVGRVIKGPIQGGESFVYVLDEAILPERESTVVEKLGPLAARPSGIGPKK